ncbi:hypothetical protein HY772_06935 [Candidatus Woesearchaeota archaeon]|nr:hypothetical protein [Candidatus Woesearchaeota archaeon]
MQNDSDRKRKQAMQKHSYSHRPSSRPLKKPTTLKNIVVRTRAYAHEHPLIAGAICATGSTLATFTSIETAKAAGSRIPITPSVLALESIVVGSLFGLASYLETAKIDVATPVLQAASDGWKKIYMHPKESAFAAGALSIPYVYSMRELGYSLTAFPFNHFLKDSDSLTAQLVVSPQVFGVISYFILSQIKNAGGLTNLFFNWIAADYYQSRGRHDAAIAIRKRMVRDNPSNINYRLQLIDHCLSGNAFDEVFEQIRLLPDAIAAHDNQTVLARTKKRVIAVALNAMKKALRPTTDESSNADITPQLFEAIIAHLRADEPSAIRAWQRIIAHYPDEPEVQFLYAQALDALHRPKMSKLQWKIGIEKLLGKPDIERAFTPVGIQRNAVFVYSSSKLICSTLHFKRKIRKQGHLDGAADELKKEHETMMFLRDCLGDRIAQSLGVFAYKHTDYLVVKTAGACTLDSLLDRMQAQKRKQTLIKAAELLADIHINGSCLEESRLKSDMIISNYPSYYLQRSGTECATALAHDPRIILGPKAVPRMMNALTHLTHSLLEIPHHFYKDHSPKNIIMSDLDELVCIDFEARKELACMLDMITLLEFGRAYVNDDEKQSIVQAYFAKRKKYTADIPSLRDMMRWYHLCGIQRHLEIFMYRSKNITQMTPEEDRSARDLIVFRRDQARSHAETFAKSFATGGEEGHARALEQTLSEIIVINPYR